MDLRTCFIKATEAYNTFEKNVPAYYFRRSFTSDSATRVKITVAVCGFYELYFNGERITRGFLSPYISNPDHFVYYDEYEVELACGENVVALMLGNGFQNNPGGYIWDFDKADFRSAPLLALSVCDLTDGSLLLDSSSGFVTAPSPIRSDDYRFGEIYDARCEIDGWCDLGFDDSAWCSAINAAAPRGELRHAENPPIIKECEMAPVDIFPCADGYIYDFGISNAGICRLSIRGECAQPIELTYVDSLIDGEPNIAQIWFPSPPHDWERDKDIVHRDVYICSGQGKESYQPTFTYHGFRYVRVRGITAEQATPELLTYLVYHTELHTRGDFSCSDSMATTLQLLTRRSITSNFHHFPTDCPQREKNGWTADAALSCEAALINFDPEKSYGQWMQNICAAQRENGSIPGIVPTAGWGFAWGNGPAWDSVLAYLPYYTYIYRGETEMIRNSAPSLVRYLRYLRSRCDERGLLAIGLGDWCQVGGIDPVAPLVLTDSLMAMNIAAKTAVMLNAIGNTEEAEEAKREVEKYRHAIREHLIDRDTLVAAGSCQSSQAMCLYYGIFDASESDAAFDVLLDMIHAKDDHIDVGVLGGRVIFHVLSDHGCSDLAFHMITREDYPSYGNWVKRGATTLWENFHPDTVGSMNHHFWGDISAWFIKRVAGINVDMTAQGTPRVKITPAFISKLDNAEAYHIAPMGRIDISWRRDGGGVTLTLSLPGAEMARLVAPMGYTLVGKENGAIVGSGSYRFVRSN